MNCSRCRKPSKENYCNKCFIDIIEQRIRREMRLGRLIRKNDRVCLVNDDSAEFWTSRVILKQLHKTLPFTMTVKKKLGSAENECKIVLPWSADHEAQYLLDAVFTNTGMENLGHYHDKKRFFIKLCLPILHSEAVRYATLQRCKFTEHEKSHISKIIDKLEKEFPEIKFTLLKSTRALLKK